MSFEITSDAAPYSFIFTANLSFRSLSKRVAFHHILGSGVFHTSDERDGATKVPPVATVERTNGEGL